MEKLKCNRCKKEFENDIYREEDIESKEMVCPDCREEAILDFLE